MAVLNIPFIPFCLYNTMDIISLFESQNVLWLLFCITIAIGYLYNDSLNMWIVK